MKYRHVFLSLASIAGALVSIDAAAATPVSCTWSLVSIQALGSAFPLPITRLSTYACKAGATTIATRQITSGVFNRCTITTKPGYTYTGSCTAPTFFTAVDPVVMTSKMLGQVGSGAACVYGAGVKVRASESGKTGWNYYTPLSCTSEGVTKRLLTQACQERSWTTQNPYQEHFTYSCTVSDPASGYYLLNGITTFSDFSLMKKL